MKSYSLDLAEFWHGESSEYRSLSPYGQRRSGTDRSYIVVPELADASDQFSTLNSP
jgi:hypothetical protein